MPDLSAFPITRRWPAEHPDRLQLYSLPTPNGVKVSIMLEEIGLPYEPHLVDFGKSDQQTPEKFAGQRVRIVGTLDARTKTIQLDSIRPATSKGK